MTDAIQIELKAKFTWLLQPSTSPIELEGFQNRGLKFRSGAANVNVRIVNDPNGYISIDSEIWNTIEEVESDLLKKFIIYKRILYVSGDFTAPSVGVTFDFHLIQKLSALKVDLSVEVFDCL